jgi:hypothetical protein
VLRRHGHGSVEKCGRPNSNLPEGGEGTERHGKAENIQMDEDMGTYRRFPPDWDTLRQVWSVDMTGPAAFRLNVAVTRIQGVGTDRNEVAGPTMLLEDWKQTWGDRLVHCWFSCSFGSQIAHVPSVVAMKSLELSSPCCWHLRCAVDMRCEAKLMTHFLAVPTMSSSDNGGRLLGTSHVPCQPKGGGGLVRRSNSGESSFVSIVCA